MLMEDLRGQHRRLKEQSEKIQLEVANFEKFIVSVEEFARSASEEQREALAAALRKPLDRHSQFLQPIETTSQAKPEDVAREVEQLLGRVGRPMKRGAIVEALAEQGFDVPGKDKNKNLGTILWRHKEKFVQLPKLGYWLRDAELPGVYTPGDLDYEDITSID